MSDIIKNKQLIVDLDETIFLCQGLLRSFFNEKLGREPVACVMDVRYAYDLDEETALQLIQEFWFSDAFANLPPEPSAKTVLPCLRDAGWNFVGITACSNDPEIVERRKKNIKNVFGFDMEIFCTGFDGSKKDYLKNYEPAIWVEDHFKNALDGALLGHKSFLLHREYNANTNHELVTRVTDWHDIAKYIDNFN